VHTKYASVVSGAHHEKERLIYGNVNCLETPRAWPYVYSKWRDVLSVIIIFTSQMCATPT